MNSCFTVWKLFGSHVFLNRGWLTGNRPGSTRCEKIATATPLVVTKVNSHMAKQSSKLSDLDSVNNKIAQSK